MVYAKTKEDGTEVLVMHACGHDAHITWMLGVAKIILALKNEWKGTLVFVAQPAEELAKGAKAMIDDKMYEKAFYFSFRYYAPKENNLPFYNCSLVNHYLTIGGH